MALRRLPERGQTHTYLAAKQFLVKAIRTILETLGAGSTPVQPSQPESQREGLVGQGHATSGRIKQDWLQLGWIVPSRIELHQFWSGRISWEWRGPGRSHQTKSN